MDKFVIHACEQVLRFTQVDQWNNLTEELKVQLGFNLGAVAHGLNLSKEDGFLALSNARQEIITMQEFRQHLESLIASHGIEVDAVNITKPF